MYWLTESGGAVGVMSAVLCRQGYFWLENISQYSPETVTGIISFGITRNAVYPSAQKNAR